MFYGQVFGEEELIFGCSRISNMVEAATFHPNHDVYAHALFKKELLHVYLYTWPFLFGHYESA